jgi:NAD(P)-dependent dehydrogenase (short-subunit alcohol dehydrogenase family)
MLIESGTLPPDALAGRVAVVTGAGGGIGYQAARSLCRLGARVVIAELDRRSGRRAAQQLRQDFGPEAARFVRTDVGRARSVRRLARAAGRVDIVINNATVVPLGGVQGTAIDAWDASYRVNLRGPVLLARAFVPGMVDRDRGVFVCVSSTGTAYMGAYEALKAAQVHLATTLAEELAGTGVSAFAIGPGFVPTRTATESLPRLAALMGRDAGELRATVAAHALSAEAAGAGFAAAVAQAARYHGQETSSVQALIDAGIELPAADPAAGAAAPAEDDFPRALALCRAVRSTLAEQSAGWQARSVFERQWLVRAFRRVAGRPVEEWLDTLAQLEDALERRDADALATVHAPLERLAAYYAHLHEMARGYVRDPAQRAEQLRIVAGWRDEVEALRALLAGDTAAPDTERSPR